jgi:hypothetical protein
MPRVALCSERNGAAVTFLSEFNRFSTINRYSIIALNYKNPLSCAIAPIRQHIIISFLFKLELQQVTCQGNSSFMLASRYEYRLNHGKESRHQDTLPQFPVQDKSQ